MTDQNRQFDKYGRLSDRFREDLRNLFEPAGSVPPEVDRAILAQAPHRLARPRRIILPLRWAGGIAAAAAVITLGVFLYYGARSDNHPSSIINPPRRSGGLISTATAAWTFSTPSSSRGTLNPASRSTPDGTSPATAAWTARMSMWSLLPPCAWVPISHCGYRLWPPSRRDGA